MSKRKLSKSYSLSQPGLRRRYIKKAWRGRRTKKGNTTPMVSLKFNQHMFDRCDNFATGIAARYEDWYPYETSYSFSADDTYDWRFNLNSGFDPEYDNNGENKQPACWDALAAMYNRYTITEVAGMIEILNTSEIPIFAWMGFSNLDNTAWTAVSINDIGVYEGSQKKLLGKATSSKDKAVFYFRDKPPRALGRSEPYHNDIYITAGTDATPTHVRYLHVGAHSSTLLTNITCTMVVKLRFKIRFSAPKRQVLN